MQHKKEHKEKDREKERLLKEAKKFLKQSEAPSPMLGGPVRALRSWEACDFRGCRDSKGRGKQCISTESTVQSHASGPALAWHAGTSPWGEEPVLSST